MLFMNSTKISKKKKTLEEFKPSYKSKNNRNQNLPLSVAQILQRIRREQPDSKRQPRSHSRKRSRRLSQQSRNPKQSSRTTIKELRNPIVQSRSPKKQKNSKQPSPTTIKELRNPILRSPKQQLRNPKQQLRNPKKQKNSKSFDFSTGQIRKKPIIPPKSFVILLKEKPKKSTYNQRIIDYKHCLLLQLYIGLGGKILPREQTNLSSKNQRFIAKTIKSSRIGALLPFVSKEKGFFR